jgi:hypothetical protein
VYFMYLTTAAVTSAATPLKKRTDEHTQNIEKNRALALSLYICKSPCQNPLSLSVMCSQQTVG